MVRWPLRPACQVPELVIAMTTMTLTDPRTKNDDLTLGRSAVKALLDEVDLIGKPGLVGPEGARGHADMDVVLMRESALSLHDTFDSLAALGASVPVGQELRDALGRVGRVGEQKMMTVTGGVNTHRGAIWNLGLHVTAAAGLVEEGTFPSAAEVTRRAGAIASLQDSVLCDTEDTDKGTCNRPGARARRRYRVGGALSEAAGGFDHVRVILRAMRDADNLGLPEADQRLHGLLTCMGSLVDTCLLHRGGMNGLDMVRAGARDVSADTVRNGRLNRIALDTLDRQMSIAGLSPGGSADLLACALFLLTQHQYSKGLTCN